MGSNSTYLSGNLTRHRKVKHGLKDDIDCSDEEAALILKSMSKKRGNIKTEMDCDIDKKIKLPTDVIKSEENDEHLVIDLKSESQSLKSIPYQNMLNIKDDYDGSSTEEEGDEKSYNERSIYDEIPGDTLAMKLVNKLMKCSKS